jgi:hypothetical protein
VGIADFPGPWLGMAFPGAIWIDQNAAGYGWSLDPAASPGAGKVDLLTVVEHELGHELGLADNTGTGLMGLYLAPGARRAPVSADATALRPSVVASAVAPGVRLLPNASDLLALHPTGTTALARRSEASNLQPRPEDDLLIGGVGRDLLIGGLAGNPPLGADSEQLQSAGTAEAGHHELALQALLAEWTAAKDIQGGSVWRDGSPFRTDKLARVNATLDVLTEGSDQDCLFSDGDISQAT